MNDIDYRFIDHKNMNILTSLFKSRVFSGQLHAICEHYPDTHTGPRLILARYSDEYLYIIIPKGFPILTPPEYVFLSDARTLKPFQFSEFFPLRISSVIGSVHPIDSLYPLTDQRDNSWTLHGADCLNHPLLLNHLAPLTLTMHFYPGHLNDSVLKSLPELIPFSSIPSPSNILS